MCTNISVHLSKQMAEKVLYAYERLSKLYVNFMRIVETYSSVRIHIPVYFSFCKIFLLPYPLESRVPALSRSNESSSLPPLALHSLLLLALPLQVQGVLLRNLLRFSLYK